MEKTYFTALTEDLKTELAWNYGDCITIVETPKLFISLFLLDKFFVEIRVDKKKRELIGINLQDDRDILFAYLKDLDIEQLFDNWPDSTKN